MAIISLKRNNRKLPTEKNKKSIDTLPTKVPYKIFFKETALFNVTLVVINKRKSK